MDSFGLASASPIGSGQKEITISTHSVGSTLVIQTCQVSKGDSRGVFVLLEGRPEGLFSFLLSLVGLETKVRFEVSKNSVSKRTVGWWWRQTQAIPCQNVGSTEFGYSRNFLALLAVAFFLSLAVGSLFAPNIANALVLRPEIGADFRQGVRDWYMVVAGAASGATLVFVVVFFQSKRLVIQVESGGGKLVGVKFRPGLVEGVPLTIKTVEDVVDIINLVARDAII